MVEWIRFEGIHFVAESVQDERMKSYVCSDVKCGLIYIPVNRIEAKYHEVIE